MEFLRKYFIFIFLLSLVACNKQADSSVKEKRENKEMKAMMQGIWLDESENVAFRAKGDTIYYPDSTSMSVEFKVMDDSIVIGDSQYKIMKLSQNLFCMENASGDEVRYTKTDDESYMEDFKQKKVDIKTYSGVYKTDTVITWQGERYRSYIAVNPTRYRVICSTLNDDGVEVSNVYYDNIIHISVFNGARQVFSRDFRKQQYAKFIPGEILEKSILNNIELSYADASGLHFYTSICMPGAVSCYMLDTRITYDGKLFMELLSN